MSAFSSRLILALIGLLGMHLVSCSSTQGLAPSPSLEGSPTVESTPVFNNRALPKPMDGKPSAAPIPNDRPGIGTSWGEGLDSSISFTSFKRGLFAKPYATSSLYYNDTEGAEAMANYLGGAVPLNDTLITAAKGVIDWGLKNPKTGYLDGYLADGKVILAGDEGDRYIIEVRNNTVVPLEFIVSVDGLDVIDGKSATLSKRGYIVGPKRSVNIEGYRTSTNRVAAFRFGKVKNSYAVLKTNKSRNVGVIGVAVFTPAGKNPWQSKVDEEDLRIRDNASPFQGRFALPPS